MKSKEVKRIGVSKLINALYNENPLAIIPEYYLKMGRLLHTKFGYYENISFAKYYEFEGVGYLIMGIPDLIEGDTVVEFKVAFSPRTVSKQRKKGETQANIYAWLGNLPHYRCDVYNYKQNHLQKGKPKPRNDEMAKNTIELALKLLKSYENWLSERKRIINGESSE